MALIAAYLPPIDMHMEAAVARITNFVSRTAHWYCEHFHKLTGVHTDEAGKYQRCLDCGRRVCQSDALVD